MARTASPSLCAYQWMRSHSPRCSRGSTRGTCDLELGRVEEERSEPIEIARVERGAEGIEDLRLRRSFTLVRRLDELAPPAMQRRLDPRAAGIISIGDYIDNFDNPQRRHSHLGYINDRVRIEGARRRTCGVVTHGSGGRSTSSSTDGCSGGERPRRVALDGTPGPKLRYHHSFPAIRTVMPSSEMFVRDVGSGRAVVLLHSSPGSAEQFRPLTEALRKTRRVLVPELPGYDRSPPPPLSIAESQDLLEQTLLGLGVAEVDAVGFSLGGYRALRLALGSRVRVGTVVSLGGFASLADAHRAGLRALADVAARLPGFDDPSFRALVVSMMVAPSFMSSNPDEVAEIAAWLDCTTPAALAAELRASAAAEDLEPRLPALRSRLVARVGELDAAAPPAYSRQMVAAVPGACLEIVPRCGHALLSEDAEATVRSVCVALG
jgi:3-oxoadipate enol-lactonase